MPSTESISKGRLWTSRTIAAVAVVFLAFDCGVKLLGLAPAVQATSQLGFTAGSVSAIGIIELVCLALYVVPRTSVLGAILLTGYLGGAVASQARAGNPLFSNVLFPIYVGALVWGGLLLRDPELRALVPFRASWPPQH